MNDEPTFDPRRKAAIRELVVRTARSTASVRGRKRTALVVALVLLALGISGGSVAYAIGTGLIELKPASIGTPAPTSSPTPTVIPAPTPEPPASTVDPSDPATWIIDFDRVGPVALGSSFETQRQTLPSFAEVTDSVCAAHYLDLQAPSDLTFIFMRPADGSDTTAGIEFGNLGSKLHDDSSHTPRTAAGIGIGSTLPELKTAYPTLQQTGTYNDIVTYYGITDGNGAWIVFRVMDSAVTDIQIADERLVPVENVGVKTMPHERCPA